MPGNESVLIDGFIQAAQAERDQPLPDDVAFETFAAQMVLRDQNLSDEEIEAGRIGGGRDGGLDGVYVFLDGVLLDEDSPIFEDGFAPRDVRKGAALVLHVIQAKRTASFAETAFDKADSSLRRLLDLNQGDNELAVYYADDVIARIRLFTRAWQALAIRSPDISISFDYVTKGTVSSAASAVTQKAADLEAVLAESVPGAATRARLVGARELWVTADKAPKYDLQLRFGEYFSKGESYTGLVNLADYYEFLADDSGALRGHLFDWNVRDFQGGVTVNRGIQDTLENPGQDDFWWLNNGVTILCSEVSISGDKTFTMEDVQIVNGMQTSYSIHAAVARMGVETERPRGRSLLVRVFETQNEASRDRIIRATNSQTKVPDASLHATEGIHRQLEAYFLANGWFYDRRKNFYKNAGKPTDRIVSISALGQAVMAIGLTRPDDARARPSTLLNNAADYKKVFSTDIPLQTYLWLAQFQRRVDALLMDLTWGEGYIRTNYRFGVSSYLATQLLGTRIYSPAQLGELSQQPIALTTEQILAAQQQLAEASYLLEGRNEWPTDRAVKSRAFAEAVARMALGGPADEDETEQPGADTALNENLEPLPFAPLADDDIDPR